jgi:hypothetical protein
MEVGLEERERVNVSEKGMDDNFVPFEETICFMTR